MNTSLRRTSAAIAAGVLVAGVVAGCGQSGGSSGEEGGGGATFVFGASADPKVIDGAYVSDGESLRVIDQVFETLVSLKPGTTEVQPGLAESWEASPDGLSWTFHLRSGVKFHDGTDFNAEAVCFNFDRWYNFKGAQQNPDVTYYWQNVFGGFATKDLETSPDTSLYKSCDATDESTAVVNLTSPSSSFVPALVLVAFGMASPAAIEKYGDGIEVSGDSVSYTGKFGMEHPVGTGPFKFKSWQPGDKLTLDRNEDYWGEKAKIKTLIFKPISDGPARRQALENGEIDGYDFVSPEDLDALKSQGFQLLERPAFNLAYVGFNQAIKPLDNIKIRQAIAHALNREALAKAKYPPGAEVATQFMPPSLWGHSDDVVKYDYNPDKAKQLIAESGVANPTIEFWYPTDVARPYMPDPQANFESFKADLEAVGFKVVPKSAPWNPDYLEAAHNGKAAVYLLGWTGDWGDPDNFVGVFFRKKSADWGFDDPELFGMIQAALEETDQAKREEMYKGVNEHIMEMLPGVPYIHTKPSLAFAPGVTGYTPSPVTLESFATVDIKKG